MSQKKFSYAVSGYRYAPESFRAFKKSIHGDTKEIPLSAEQRSEVGTLYLTQGLKAAVDYVKRIERERERKCRLYTTYGFFSKEEPHTYLFCKEIRCRDDAPLDKKLRIFRASKDILSSASSVRQWTECELDAHYHPVNIQSHNVTLTVDFNRPVKVFIIAEQRRKAA